MKKKIYGINFLEKTRTTTDVNGGRVLGATISYEMTLGSPGHPEPDQQTDSDIEVFGLVIGT